MRADDYDDVTDLGLQVGSFARWSPYEGLTDEQADKLQAELEALERRKIPLGFRRSDEAGPPVDQVVGV